jgi:hypothetical protein
VHDATAGGSGSQSIMPRAIPYWQHGNTYFIPNRPARLSQFGQEALYR